MFRSKIRPVIIPQYEHARLAGALAALWGNAEFDLPVFDLPAFVEGVAFHDWHYGILDTVPVGGSDPAAWLAIVRKGVAHRFDSPVTDIVAKLHIRRLLAMRESPEHSELIARIDQRITERLPSTGFTLEQFHWADRITEFCDDVAFDFAFEKPVQRTLAVHARTASTAPKSLEYEIGPNGRIRIEPWPFSIDAFAGIVIGYEEAGYPETLSPLVVPYEAERMRRS